MNSHAPIALFVFNRPSHTEETISHLRQNEGSRHSDLIIFSDGPRSPEDEAAVAQTRARISNLTGFRSVRTVLHSGNFGLAESIIKGVTGILQEYDRVIVLEDDMVTSPQFVNYMNEALNQFAGNDRVGSVHAYMYPISGLPDFFFMKGGDCWGWATWRDRWRLFESNGRHLLRLLYQKQLAREFNGTGGDRMIRMLVDQIRGNNSSWFIRWHASLFLNEKLTLQPGRSFIRNIGTDDSGTHGGATNAFDVSPQQLFKGLPSLEVINDPESVEKIRRFFLENRKSHWYRRLFRICADEFEMRRTVLSKGEQVSTDRCE